MTAKKNSANRSDAAGGPTAGMTPEEIMALVRQYLLPVVVGLVIGVAIFLGIAGYRYHRERKIQQGFTRLMQARQVADLEQIGRDYRGTPPAMAALLAAGAAYYHDDQFGLAMQRYSELLRQFPDHPLAPIGELDRAYCLEALGQQEQARSAFLSLATNQNAQFVQDAARIGAARCLEQMKRVEEAESEYRQFVEERPESPWAPLARTALLYVRQDLRLAQKEDTSLPWLTPSQPEALPLPLAEPESSSEPAESE